MSTLQDIKDIIQKHSPIIYDEDVEGLAKDIYAREEQLSDMICARECRIDELESVNKMYLGDIVDKGNEIYKLQVKLKSKLSTLRDKIVSKEKLSEIIYLSTLWNFGQEGHNALSELVESIQSEIVKCVDEVLKD